MRARSSPLSLFIYHNTYIYIYIGARVCLKVRGQYFLSAREIADVGVAEMRARRWSGAEEGR